MHFAKSKKILETLIKAKHILINVHRNPDLDSVGSALAIQHVLKTLGNKATLVGPHSVDSAFLFLPGTDTIKTVDFHTFDFKPYDLFLILDSASAQIVTSDPKLSLPPLPLLVIDHHKGNNILAKIKLVKEDASATAEIIYYLLQDWKMTIPKDLATILYAAICHDTVFFKYTENDEETFQIASDLMKLGADKNTVLFHIYQNLKTGFVKQVGTLLRNIKQEGGFVWTALGNAEFEKMGCPAGLREYVADHFIQSVQNTRFGMVMVEEEKGKLCVSFRGKKGCDVSVIAIKLGGGGHLYRAGATVYGEFTKSIKKVLMAAHF